jgi:hypothetical protein
MYVIHDHDVCVNNVLKVDNILNVANVNNVLDVDNVLNVAKKSSHIRSRL